MDNSNEAAAQEEIDKVLKAQDEAIEKRVTELTYSGQHELAAQMQNAYSRRKLPEGHPGKSVHVEGELTQEQLQEYYSFQAILEKNKEEKAFDYAMIAGSGYFKDGKFLINDPGQAFKALYATVLRLAVEIPRKFPEAVSYLTTAILDEKRKEGLLPKDEASTGE